MSICAGVNRLASSAAVFGRGSKRYGTDGACAAAGVDSNRRRRADAAVRISWSWSPRLDHDFPELFRVATRASAASEPRERSAPSKRRRGASGVRGRSPPANYDARAKSTPAGPPAIAALPQTQAPSSTAIRGAVRSPSTSAPACSAIRSSADQRAGHGARHDDPSGSHGGGHMGPGLDGEDVARDVDGPVDPSRHHERFFRRDFSLDDERRSDVRTVLH